jgi:serine/threonine-protein kinase
MKEAAEAMMKSIALNPRRAEYLFNAAQTYELLRDYPKAEDLFGRAISLNPELVPTYVTWARAVLMEDGNTTRARKVLDRASRLSDYSMDPNSVYFRVYLEILDGRYREALALAAESFRAPLDEQFQYIPRPLLLAWIHKLLKNDVVAAALYDSARVDIEGQIASDPNDGRFRSALGITLAGLGRKDEAIAAGRKGVELLPVQKEAWRGAYRLIELAQIYAMTGEPREAVKVLEKLLAMPANIDRSVLKIDPVWVSLKNEPSFQKLLAAK